MSSTESDNRGYDTVVVGNGALGSSLALTLVRRGQRVALLGEPHRPWAASTAAGAMLGCFGEVTTTLVSSAYGRAKLELDVQATGLWPQWSAELADAAGGPNVRSANGTVVMLNTIGVPGIDDANYAAIQAELRRYDEPFEDIDPADIDWLDPHPSSRPLRACFIPGEHAVDSAALLGQLQEAFQRAGGTIIAEQASRVDYANGRVTGVTLASGDRITAADVVLAAGARSQDLLDTVPDVAPRVPRLVSGYGVSVLVDTEDGSTPDSVIRTPNRAFACGLHVVPRSTGQVYVGATNIISPEPVSSPVMRDVLFLLGCANKQVRRNLWDSGINRIQVGNRPVSLDGFPLLGKAELDGLWMMTGTYRDGLHLSPLLAREMSARILGESGECDLEVFAPVRAPLQTASREQIVDTAVEHMMATGYEYDWQLPVDWPVIMETNLHSTYTRWAGEFDEQFTPPPELLAASRLHSSLVKMLREYYAASHAAAR